MKAKKINKRHIDRENRPEASILRN